MKNVIVAAVTLLLGAMPAMAEGISCEAAPQDQYAQLVCSDARLKALNSEVNKLYGDLLASKPVDAENIKAFYQHQYPSDKAWVKCGSNVFCTEGALLGLKEMLTGEHAFVGKYAVTGKADILLPAQPRQPYKVNNIWFDPRKHRTPTTSVVMRGRLSSGSALNYHTLVLELGGGYNVLLGLMENFPVDAVAQLNQLLASKRPVLVKGELLRSKESSLAMDTYAPIEIRLAR